MADRHESAHRRGGDLAHAGSRDQWYGVPGRVPATVERGSQDGTAETGPNATLTNDWMIAFAPANDPKVAVAVVVPNQPGSDTGAWCPGRR